MGDIPIPGPVEYSATGFVEPESYSCTKTEFSDKKEEGPKLSYDKYKEEKFVNQFLSGFKENKFFVARDILVSKWQEVIEAFFHV